MMQQDLTAHSEHGAPLTWAVVIGFTEWADKVDQSDETPHACSYRAL